MRGLTSFCFLVGAIQLSSTEAFVSSSQARDMCPLKAASDDHFVDRSRRDSFASIVGVTFGAAAVMSSPAPALAAADCMKDCFKNCLLIAPKDKEYCTDSCTAYCAQDDRTDGLSGSVSAANGEVGILGGSFGQGTVPKGEDKPPSLKLPGLDFSTQSGKKLLGY